VAIGGWYSEEAEGGLGRKDVPASPALATAGFIFLRSAATLSLSAGDCSSRRTKGETRKCAETLTSLFRNALISADHAAPEQEREILRAARRDAGNTTRSVATNATRVAETAPNAGHVRQEPVADARNTKGAGREREGKKDR